MHFIKEIIFKAVDFIFKRKVVLSHIMGGDLSKGCVL
jgi:hypothetical protein